MKLVKNYNDFINEKLTVKNEYNVDYTLVGYVKNSTVEYVTGDYYIFMKTSYLEDTINKDILNTVLITSDDKARNSSITGYLNSGLIHFIDLLPEYRNNVLVEDLILGDSKENRLKRSKELMDTIRTDVNGYAILLHNSNRKITNGYMKIGMEMNSWSIDDFRIDPTPRTYFWGTNGGSDISSGGMYKYICKLPIDKIYPMGIGCNPEKYNTFKEVMSHGYSAVSYYIGVLNKSYGIVVTVFEDLPIEEIQYNGKIYDSNWNELD